MPRYCLFLIRHKECSLVVRWYIESAKRQNYQPKILYQEKGIPYVFIPVKDWDNYVDAWSSKDMKSYNDMMHRLIIESYQYFYGSQSVTDITNSKSYGKTIINTNRNR